MYLEEIQGNTNSDWLTHTASQSESVLRLNLQFLGGKRQRIFLRMIGAYVGYPKVQYSKGISKLTKTIYCTKVAEFMATVE